MNELSIGDMVLSKDGAYSKVYSFGHMERDSKADFLEVKMAGKNAPLEVTADHMLYVDAVGLLPAGKIKVGDYLVTSKQQAYPAEVISVKMVQRHGIYSPFTVSGEIIVNGIAASNYVALPPTFQFQFSFEDQHWLQHTSFTPYRAFCNLLGCDGETYNETTGLSHAVMFWMPLLQWIEKYGPILLPGVAFLVMVVQASIQNSMYLVAVVLGWLVWAQSNNRAFHVEKALNVLTKHTGKVPVNAKM